MFRQARNALTRVNAHFTRKFFLTSLGAQKWSSKTRNLENVNIMTAAGYGRANFRQNTL
jgi:hypothetical protein